MTPICYFVYVSFGRGSAAVEVAERRNTRGVIVVMTGPVGGVHRRSQSAALETIFNLQSYLSIRSFTTLLPVVIGVAIRYIFCVMNSSPISVEEAIRRVVAATQPLAVERLTLSTKLLGRTLAEPLISKAPFPHFRASIMDGYAVCGPLQPGVYRITQHMHAGDASKGDLAANEVSYIATGAKVPDTANAVVKIEETRKISEEEVEILVAVKEGDHIRQIGSDIEFGEEVLAKGTVLGPIELGLMATTGFTEGIPCLRRPVIGVMSTGNELVDPSTPDAALGEAQVRDSNRITLIGSFQMEHFEVIDYGIMPDDLDTIRAKLWQAVRECDVVITSGGVSMGNKDYIKFLLLNDESFSPHVTLHFNKLNMKPGKPTTFATITSGGAGGGGGVEAAEKQTLFFGLPGNPVSCIVTKTLFVDVALRRLQGFSALQSLHTEVTVTLLGDKAITLDPERPEYHRVSIFATGPSTSSAAGPSTKLVAYSTGNQRSSRLLSMKTANGLLYLPQGPGKAVFGQEYRALLISQLPVPILDQDSMHKLAAAEEAGAATAAAASLVHLPRSFTDKLQAKAAASSASIGSSRCCPAHLSHADGAWKHIRVGILTISDRVRSSCVCCGACVICESRRV